MRQPVLSERAMQLTREYNLVDAGPVGDLHSSGSIGLEIENWPVFSTGQFFINIFEYAVFRLSITRLNRFK